jgi:hypothetical protein
VTDEPVIASPRGFRRLVAPRSTPIIDPHTAMADYVARWVFAKTSIRPKTINRLSEHDLRLICRAIEVVDREPGYAPDKDW